LSLAEMLHELMDFLRYDATLPVRAVKLEISAEPTVRGNKTKLQQVLVNLLKNAAHAIAEVPDGRIVVSLDCSGDRAVLRVQDNGTGMSAEVMQRMWDPFFTTKGANGTGLGLDISRSIIESHDGRIECQSKLGEGATFTILLPTANPPAAARPSDAVAGQVLFSQPGQRVSNTPGEFPRI
jgi:signal transduction histidine kinase